MLKRYLLGYQPFYESSGGGGGGGGDVQNIGVPGPDDSDIDLLAGDDGDAGDDKEGEEEGDEGEEEGEGKGKEKPPKKAKSQHEGEDFDVDVSEGEEDEEKPEGEEDDDEEKPPKGEDEEEGEGKPQGIVALKKAYPDIFKKFPDLRKSLGEHQRFRSIFSSIDEATEVVEQAERFNQISDTLFGGDFETLMDAMEGEERGSSAKLVQKILPTIKSKNKDLYFDITEPVLKEFLHAAFQRANASGDEKLKNSTYWLNAFLTGAREFPKPAGERGPDPRDKEVDDKIQKFEQKKRQDSQKTVWGDIRSQLEHRIERALDPTGKGLKGKDTTKSALIRALVGEIDNTIAQDEIHMNKVNRLWIQARRSSYSQGHLSRITAAYLERANQLLPKLAKKVREENGLEEEGGKGERREKEGESRQPQRTNIRPPARLTGGRVPAPKSLRDVNPKRIDYKRTSDDDILSGKVKLRRR